MCAIKLNIVNGVRRRRRELLILKKIVLNAREGSSEWEQTEIDVCLTDL